MRGAAGFEKRVIIKTILPHLAEEEEFIEKFLDEGRIVVQLTHGNIVPVFDMGEEHGEFFIAMEYIPGRDLRDLIKTKQISGEAVDVPIALHIIAEVCKGLGYAHRKRDEQGDLLELVHRDVSPSNVLISSEGEVKLIDFGIARATTKISRTVSGRIQGKFSYMSPEQASGKLVDARSDIFSTGVMLYEMLTGKRPFDGVTDLETIDLVRKCEYDSASTLNPLIPEEVDGIIERALCRELDDRYQTIDQMQADLLSYLYREGCAPSSRDVVSYLSETFSGEIERGELRSGTPSHTSLGSKQTGPKRLDDILGAQLDLLGGGGGIADPFTRTDASLPTPPASSPHTATLITDSAPPAPRLIDEEDKIVELIPAPSTTGTTRQEPPSTPEVPDDEDVASDAEDVAAVVEHDEPDEPDTSTQTDVPVIAPQTKPSGRGRAIAVGAVLILAAIAGGIWFSQRNAPGTLKVTTSPTGAQLTLDGARVLDAVTPLQFDVTPGWHDISLSKQGYDPYTIRLKMKPGQVIDLEGGRLTLTPITPIKDSTNSTRTITIATRPIGATLLLDGREIGPSPQDIQVEEDRTVIVYAKKEGCEDADVTLSHRYANPSYTLSMLCREERLPSVISEPRTDPDKPTPPRIKQVSVMVRVQPSDAVITINGSTSREGVYTGRLPSNKKLKIQAFKKGYKTFERTTTAGSLKGGALNISLQQDAQKCIDIRLMQIQMADDVLIDGRSIGPVKSSKRGVEVSPGKHTIRAINTIAGRDETTTINVPEDATSCVNAVLFPMK
jgi:serine/threonine protein kinase